MERACCGVVTSANGPPACEAVQCCHLLSPEVFNKVLKSFVMYQFSQVEKMRFAPQDVEDIKCKVYKHFVHNGKSPISLSPC